MEGIALELRQAHAGIEDEPQAVRCLDDGLAAAADRHGLPAAGPSGVLMRLDDARGKDEIGVGDALLHVAVHAKGWDHAEIGPMLDLMRRQSADMVQGDRSRDRKDNLIRRIGSVVGRTTP